MRKLVCLVVLFAATFFASAEEKLNLFICEYNDLNVVSAFEQKH